MSERGRDRVGGCPEDFEVRPVVSGAEYEITPREAPRKLRSLVPRILIVATVPGELPDDWVKFMPMGLLLKSKAFWQSLHGAPEVKNSSTVQVKLPRAQPFTVDNLNALMQRIADGGRP